MKAKVVLLSLMLLSNTSLALQGLDLAQAENLEVALINVDESQLEQSTLRAILGQYDISALLSREKNLVRIQSPSALEPGRYPLQIFLVEPSGNQILVYEDKLDIYRASWQKGIHLRTKATQRIDESAKEDFSHTVDLLSESALQSQARFSGRNTAFHSAIQAQHRSDSQTQSGKKLELAHFKVGANKKTAVGNLGFSLGNQTIQRQGLVFNGFDRRGLSTSLESESGRYQLNTFYINSDPALAVDEQLLPTDKQQRSYGSTLDFSVFKEHPERLRLSSGFIKGQTKNLGTGIIYLADLNEDNAPTLGGSTWHLAADSRWLENALHLHAQKAHSQFDSDGIGVGEDKQKDEATRFLVNVNSQGSLKDALAPLKVKQWNVSWQSQHVGEHYYSLANISLPRDVRIDQSMLNVGWTRFSLLLGQTRSSNNLDAQPDQAKQESTKSQVQLQYTPLLQQSNPFWRAIGQPSLSLSAAKTNRNQRDSDVNLVGYHLDDTTHENHITATFQRQKLNWSLQHGVVRFENAAAAFSDPLLGVFTPSPDTENRFTSLSLHVQAMKNWTISPVLQWTDYGVKDSRNAQEAFNAGLNLSAQLLKNRLGVHLNYNMNKQDAVYAEGLATQNYQRRQSTLSLNWQAKEAKGQKPGVTLSLNGSWSENENQFNSDPLVKNDNYQIVLGVEVFWADGEGQ